MSSPEVKELIVAQQEFLLEFRRALSALNGGAQAFAGSPSQSAQLTALDRVTGKLRAVEFDPALRGLGLAFEQKERTFISSGLFAATDGELVAADRNWRDCWLKISLADTAARTFQVNYVTGSAASAANSNLLFSIGTQLVAGAPGPSLSGFGFKKGDALRGLCSSANTVAWMLFGVEEP